jgi:prepilin signal peptidase PulO-like enzyme (type II secretory pathway)
MIPFLYFILPITFHLRAAGALFFGGDSGLWKDTVNTIIPRLWYGLDFHPIIERLTKIFILSVLLISCIYVFFKILKQKRELSIQQCFLTSLLLLFFTIILSTIAQHYLLGTLFLIERAVLFLFVLFLLILIFLMDNFSVEKKSLQFTIHTFSIGILLHFLFAINFNYVFEWKEDCETKEMLSDLEKITPLPKEGSNITINVSLPFESSINYYRVLNRMSWLNPATRSSEINYLSDFLFLRPDELEHANIDSLEIIKTYHITKNVLAKPKYPFTKTKVLCDSIIIGGKTHSTLYLEPNTVYGPGYSTKLSDSLIQKIGLISCNIQIQPLNTFSGNIYLITSYENKDGCYSWSRIRLNDFVHDNKSNTSCCITSLLNKNAIKGDELKLYIWNPNKQAALLTKMSVMFYQLSLSERLF